MIGGAAQLSSPCERQGLWIPARAPKRSLGRDDGRGISIQRRDLPYLQRAEIHRAIDKAQRKGARLLAFQHRFLAKRVDTGGDADIGVLLDYFAQPRNRAV